MSRGIIEENAATDDELRDIATGRREGRVPRVRAVVALAGRRAPGSDQVLGTVLGDVAAPVPVRTAAAAGLAYLDTPDAVAALTAATGTTTPAVIAAVATGLSRIGDERALDLLVEVQSRSAGPLRSLAAFAAVVIAHRLDIEGHDFPSVADDAYVDVPRGAPRPEMVLVSDEDARSCVAALNDEPLGGVQYSERPVYRLTCDRGSWFLVLNREVIGREAPTLVARRKLVFGVLARRNADRSSYLSGCYVLTAPAGSSRLRVFVPTTGGQHFWAGTGSLNGATARARIRALAGSGALPVELNVIYDGSQLTLVSGSFDHSIHTGREPTPTGTHPTR